MRLTSPCHARAAYNIADDDGTVSWKKFTEAKKFVTVMRPNSADPG